MTIKHPAPRDDLFLKPAADIETTIAMGEMFLAASSAVATADPKDAELSLVIPSRWKNDWFPQTLEGPILDSDANSHLSRQLSRKTIRSFDPDIDVSGEVIACLSGMLATNQHGGRAYPSPGRLYPVEVFVCTADRRVIWFDRLARAYRVKDADDLWQATQTSDLRSSGAGSATVLAVNMPRISRKYLSRGIRYALIEAGAIAMRLEIELRKHGIESFWLGGFDDESVSAGLDPDATGLIRPILIIGHGCIAQVS